jgi:hypothetical protein
MVCRRIIKQLRDDDAGGLPAPHMPAEHLQSS